MSQTTTGEDLYKEISKQLIHFSDLENKEKRLLSLEIENLCEKDISKGILLFESHIAQFYTEDKLRSTIQNIIKNTKEEALSSFFLINWNIN